jgi:hypothetical protein
MLLLAFIGLLVVLGLTTGEEESRELDRRTRQAKQIAAIVAGDEVADQLPLHDADFVEQIWQEPGCAAKIEGVCISMVDLLDQRWNLLSRFPNLKRIYFYDSRNVDMLLEPMRGKAGIKDLGFCKADLTDAGMRSIVSLPNLKRLHLFASGRCHPSAELLRGQPSIEELWLEGYADPEFAKEWLDVLKSLPRLRSLDLRGSPLNEDTLGALHKLLPNCRFRNERET